MKATNWIQSQTVSVVMLYVVNIEEKVQNQIDISL